MQQERFWGGLKHTCLLKVSQPTRAVMQQEVAADIRCYSLGKDHTANNGIPLV